MKIFAHRGASGFAPENTMEAFKLALEKGADGIELDVQLTSDGEVVVIHDDDVKRTSNGEGLVMTKTFEEIKSLDVGSFFSDKFKGAKIPTLIEVLDWMLTNEILLNIEIKTMPRLYNRELVEKTLAMVKSRNLESRIIISSFEHKAIVDSKKIAPEIKTAALMTDTILDVGNYCKTHNINCLHPYHAVVDDDMMKSCNENGIEVNVWTVNSQKDGDLMEKYNVNSIITNYPNELIKE
ncbi:MAG: glycerophosphodiester phosphodiesterase [Clostridia bacterium]